MLVYFSWYTVECWPAQRSCQEDPYPCWMDTSGTPGIPALMGGTHKRGETFTAAGRAAVCIDFPLKLNPPALPNNYPFLRVAPISAGNSIPFPSFPKVTLWRGEGVNHGKTW